MDHQTVIEVKGNSEGIVKKENFILLACCLGLGLLFDYLFYKKPFGISYPLFITAFYAVFMLNLKNLTGFKRKTGWISVIPILLLSMTYFLFSGEVFMAFNFIAVPLLVVAQTVLAAGSEYEWHDPRIIKDILYGMVFRPFAHIGKPFSLIAGLVQKKNSPGRYAVLGKVLTGLVVSVPLLLIVVGLLSSADRVFQSFIGRIFDIFVNVKVDELIAQLIIIFGVFIFTFSYIWSFLHPESKVHGLLENAYENAGQAVKQEFRGWDPVVVITVLISVNIIYVVFVVIQFTYLFGSLTYGLPEDFTYAEYARRGFFELVAVTVINFSILLSCINLTRKETGATQYLTRILYTLLVVCTIVMLFSAHFRMSLYEEAYGYTYLRMLTHAFMVYLLVLFLIALYRIWREGVSLMKPYIIVSLVAYLAVNYMNIDYIIAKNNIDRYFATGKIDIYYLESLSYDSIPQIVRLLESQDEDIARHVENYLYKKKKELSKAGPWQSFNLSKYRAKKVLSGYELTYDDSVYKEVD